MHRVGAGLDGWLTELEGHTELHRYRRAKEHDEKARQREGQARLEGLTEPAVKEAGRWHRARARGCRERFTRARACLTPSDDVSIVCGACGEVHCETALTCGAGLICFSCRTRQLAEKRQHFAACRQAVLEAAEAQGFANPVRPGGRFSEKLVTLTAPDVVAEEDDAISPEHLVRSRLARVRDAWRPFTILMHKWLRGEKRGRIFLQSHDGQRAWTSLSVWFRTFEWTPGRGDGLGHPHFHLWFFGPFLPREALMNWWRASLLAAGIPRETLDVVIVDVRAVKDGPGSAYEVIKYLTKDIVEGGQYIDPALYAPVYEALDGRRVTHATRGLMSVAEPPPAACNKCGVIGSLQFKKKGMSKEVDNGRAQSSGTLREPGGGP